MQLYLDLHCHSRFSADGVAEPEDMIAEARARGLHGFAITDHNTSACVDYFINKGFMNREGTPVDGLLIIPGQEITTAEGHLLALGVALPDNLKGMPAAQAVALIHREGGVAIPPHPYDRFRAGIRQPVLETLPIDAIEVFNAATTLKRYNRQAFQYAQGPRPAHDRRQRRPRQRGARHRLQHPGDRRLLRRRRAGGDPQGPGAAPALPHPRQRLQKNVE